MANTLAAPRGARFGHRAAVGGGERDQFTAGRVALAGRSARPGVMRGLADSTTTIFVFPGQGSQWAGMARDLLSSSSSAESAAFAASVTECAEALQEFVDWSVRDVLEGVPGAPSLGRIDVAQPALFTMMVSLAALWRSYGVEPAAVVGHSQGEVAAAYVAGGLSLRDASRIVARSSRARLTLSGQGGMASVWLPLNELHPHLECWGDRLSIAAVDGPGSVTVAGDPEALDALVTELSVAGVQSRRIRGVDTAMHCGHVEVLRERLLRELAPVTPMSARIPFYSSVTGGRLDTARLDAAYWYRNMREPVLFERATRSVVAHGHRCAIEVSPHPVLIAAMQDTAQDAGTDVAVVGTLHRRDGGLTRMLAALAEAHAHGVSVGREATLGCCGTRQANPSTHVSDRQRNRPDLTPPRSDTRAQTRCDVSDAGLEPADHPLLGAGVELAGSGEYLLTGRLSLAKHPWLADHVFGDTVLLPGAVFVELALEAGDHVGCGEVEELTLEVPLALPTRQDVRLQVTVATADASGRRALTCYSRKRNDDAWVRHATGVLASTPQVGTPAGAFHDSFSRQPAFALDLWPPTRAVPLPVDGHYERLAELGYDYGPAFQGLDAMWQRGDEIFAEVGLPEKVREQAGSFGLHPALLEAALHAWGVREPVARLPLSWSGVRLHTRGAALLRVRLSPAPGGSVSVQVADGTGQPVAAVGRWSASRAAQEWLLGLGSQDLGSGTWMGSPTELES